MALVGGWKRFEEKGKNPLEEDTIGSRKNYISLQGVSPSIYNAHLEQWYKEQMVSVIPGIQDQNRQDAYRFAVNEFIAKHAMGDPQKVMDEEFKKDFIAWLCGRGTVVDVSRTAFGRMPLMGLPGVQNYLSEFTDMKCRFGKEVTVLKERGPYDLRTAYLYFKYIVRDKNPSEDEYLSDFNIYFASPDRQTPTYTTGLKDSSGNDVESGKTYSGGVHDRRGPDGMAGRSTFGPDDKLWKEDTDKNITQLIADYGDNIGFLSAPLESGYYKNIPPDFLKSLAKKSKLINSFDEDAVVRMVESMSVRGEEGDSADPDTDIVKSQGGGFRSFLNMIASFGTGGGDVSPYTASSDDEDQLEDEEGTTDEDDGGEEDEETPTGDEAASSSPPIVRRLVMSDEERERLREETRAAEFRRIMKQQGIDPGVIPSQEQVERFIRLNDPELLAALSYHIDETKSTLQKMMPQ